MKKDRLIKILEKNKPVAVIPYDLNQEKLVVLDLTAENQVLRSIDPADSFAFNKYISSLLQAEEARVAIGRYDENRTIYDKSSIFGPSSTGQDSDANRRTLHIGLDLWTAAGTPVLAALDGLVHSFQDNQAPGDYGPTIILAHKIDGIEFFTLYGHLSKQSLQGMSKGRHIKAGEQIATLGEIHENGNWPPHLHFEIIRDLQGMQGDFPGVCSIDKRDEYLKLCPDPNLLLKIKNL